jgi:hypothetical protein
MKGALIALEYINASLVGIGQKPLQRHSIHLPRTGRLALQEWT